MHARCRAPPLDRSPRRSTKATSSPASWSHRQEVREHESVAIHDLSAPKEDGTAEHRSVVRERMKLAAFAARVDRRRDLLEKRGVVFPTSERRGELLRIDAGQSGAKAAIDHPTSQLVGGNSPKREDRLDSGTRE